MCCSKCGGEWKLHQGRRCCSECGYVDPSVVWMTLRTGREVYVGPPEANPDRLSATEWHELKDVWAEELRELKDVGCMLRPLDKQKRGKTMERKGPYRGGETACALCTKALDEDGVEIAGRKTRVHSACAAMFYAQMKARHHHPRIRHALHWIGRIMSAPYRAARALDVDKLCVSILKLTGTIFVVVFAFFASYAVWYSMTSNDEAQHCYVEDGKTREATFELKREIAWDCDTTAGVFSSVAEATQAAETMGCKIK